MLGDGFDPVSLDELDELLKDGAELIDVRERDERDGGYIAGSRNIPYRLLPVASADVPGDRPVVTICESGARAAVAASILAARGIDARPCSTAGAVGRSRRTDGRGPPLRRPRAARARPSSRSSHPRHRLLRARTGSSASGRDVLQRGEPVVTIIAVERRATRRPTTSVASPPRASTRGRVLGGGSRWTGPARPPVGPLRLRARPRRPPRRADVGALCF